MRSPHGQDSMAIAEMSVSVVRCNVLFLCVVLSVPFLCTAHDGHTHERSRFLSNVDHTTWDQRSGK